MSFLGKERWEVSGLGSSACKIPNRFPSESAFEFHPPRQTPYYYELRRQLESAELALAAPALAADRLYSLSGYGGGLDRRSSRSLPRSQLAADGIGLGEGSGPQILVKSLILDRSVKTTKSMARNEAQSMAFDLTAARRKMMKSEVRYEADATDPTAVWRVVHLRPPEEQRGLSDRVPPAELKNEKTRRTEDPRQINLNSTQGVQLKSTPEGNFDFPSNGPSVVVKGWGKDPLPHAFIASPTRSNMNPSHEPSLVGQWPQHPKEYLSQPHSQYQAKQWDPNPSNKRVLSESTVDDDLSSPNNMKIEQMEQTKVKANLCSVDYQLRRVPGKEIHEQEVYGIDPYTHNCLKEIMPADLDGSIDDKHAFIEVMIPELPEQEKRGLPPQSGVHRLSCLILVAAHMRNNTELGSEPFDTNEKYAIHKALLMALLNMVGRDGRLLRSTGLRWNIPPWPGFCALFYDRFAQRSDNEVLENSHSLKQYSHSVLDCTDKIEELIKIWPSVNEDYYAHVESREIISNLSKAVGLATMNAAMRPDLDNIDEYVRNTIARTFNVMTSALDTSALLLFLKTACQSKKSWQVRHTDTKIVQHIAILIGRADLSHMKSQVEIIERGLKDENQKVLTITALSLAALAEVTASYGIEGSDMVLKPLCKRVRSHLRKVLVGYMRNEKLSIDEIKSTPLKLFELIASIKNGTIRGKIGKEILDELIAKGGIVKSTQRRQDLVQIADLAAIEAMDKRNNICNISVIALVDHGKSTLTDSLEAVAGIIAQEVVGDVRKIDTCVDEAERSITIKYTEVTAALRITDGALVVGDCTVEYHNVDKKCRRQKLEVLELDHNTITGVKPSYQRFTCLKSLSLRHVSISVLDLSLLVAACPKMESLALDVLEIVSSDSQSTMELVSHTLKSLFAKSFGVDKIILEADNLEVLHLNALNLDLFELNGKGTLKHLMIDDVSVTHLDIGESTDHLEVVDVSNSTMVWPKFYSMISRASTLRLLRLWGDNFFDPTTKKWTTKNTGYATCKRGFVQLYYEPIKQIIKICMKDQKDKLWPILRKLGVTMKTDEKELKGKSLMKLVMQTWLQASKALLEMIPASDKGRFLSFGRVFSKKVATGMDVRILGPNYFPGQNKDLYVKSIQRIVIRMGRKQESVEDVPCGNIVAIVASDQFNTNNTTLTNEEEVDACQMRAMKFFLSLVVRVDVQCMVAPNLLQLVTGWKRLEKSDPRVLCIMEESGEHIITEAGKLYLEICLKDLLKKFLWRMLILSRNISELYAWTIKFWVPDPYLRTSMWLRRRKCHNRVF